MPVPTHRRLHEASGLARLGFLAVALLATGCGGRTALLPPTCDVRVSAASLDFGQVEPGSRGVQMVGLANLGVGTCQIATSFAEGSDPAFVFEEPSALPQVIASGQRLALAVAFAPVESWPPLHRQATLVVRSNDPDRRKVSVALAGRIKSECTLSISPSRVDFGKVALDASVSAAVHLTSTGKGPCVVAGVALGAGSDRQFGVASVPAALTLPPGSASDITVTFHAVEHARPHRRTGELVMQTTDPDNQDVQVPLSADIDVGCWLVVAPASLDFGSLILNTSATRSVSLGNEGTAACQVSGIAITPDSATGFTLAPGQAGAVTVEPDGQQSIAVRFDAADSAPPHGKTGTLAFATGNPRAPRASVPLSAVIDTSCEEASRWIYTISDTATLSKFDPEALAFTDIARLACPGGGSTPNSMAVDQHGFAWVADLSGPLFKVDITNGKCEATDYRAGQHGLYKFGMGFVFDPTTGLDTLYIAGGSDLSPFGSTLATLSFPSLVVTPVGEIDIGTPELTGTGDGQLWGFIPFDMATRGHAVLVRFDPTSAQVLESHTYESLDNVHGGWAVKFWGGSFWIFLGEAVYRVRRDTMSIETAIASTGRTVVGVGVSTCAPL